MLTDKKGLYKAQHDFLKHYEKEIVLCDANELCEKYLKNCLLRNWNYSHSDKNGKKWTNVTKAKNKIAVIDYCNNLSFQKTTFYNGECCCSRQQPK